MKYDRNWLIGISDTQHMIDNAPIDQVPIKYRYLLRNQFNVHVEAFNTDLSLGFDTTKSQVAIADLAYLAVELIEAHEKIRVEHSDLVHRVAYGR